MILFTLAALAAAEGLPPSNQTVTAPVSRETPPRPAPPPPAPTSARKSASPRNSPAYWATNDDYSAESRAGGQEGTVAFRLLIGKAGEVSDCAITQSSGFPALDLQTCALMRQRALFTPARDVSGNLVEGSYSSRVRWIIPKVPSNSSVELVPIGNPGSWATDLDYPRAAARLKQEGDVAFDLRLGADGRPVSCTVKSSSGFPELNNHACALMMARARFGLSKRTPGQLDGAIWTSVVHWKLPKR